MWPISHHKILYHDSRRYLFSYKIIIIPFFSIFFPTINRFSRISIPCRNVDIEIYIGIYIYLILLSVHDTAFGARIIRVNGENHIYYSGKQKLNAM